MAKNKRGKKKKAGIMDTDMVNRYTFSSVFGYNQQTGFLFPLFNTWINGAYFIQYSNIPKGASFGGIDLYGLVGKDVAGTWNTQTRTLTIVGFY